MFKGAARCDQWHTKWWQEAGIPSGQTVCITNPTAWRTYQARQKSQSSTEKLETDTHEIGQGVFTPHWLQKIKWKKPGVIEPCICEKSLVWSGYWACSSLCPRGEDLLKLTQKRFLINQGAKWPAKWAPSQTLWPPWTSSERPGLEGGTLSQG